MTIASFEYRNAVLYLGDCIQVMSQMDENSIDAIVTDPPFGLEFMGKDWDKFKEGKNIAGGNTGRGTPYGRSKALPAFYHRFGRKGREGKRDLKVIKNFEVLPRFFNSDLQVYQGWTTEWAAQAFRVLKPGGFMLCMGGTRTYHRLGCGIEDAGFIVRDTLAWAFASGFPKSYDISKGFDKKAGVKRNLVGKVKLGGTAATLKGSAKRQDWYDQGKGGTFTPEYEITEPSTELAKQWDGWGTALKPAWEPIILAQKPIEKNYCSNVEKWGCGGLNIDTTRLPIEKGDEPKGGYGNEVIGFGPFDNKKGAKWRLSPTVGKGRFPANLIATDPVLGGYSRFFLIPKPSRKEKEAELQGVDESSVLDFLSESLRIGGKRRVGRKVRNIHPTVKPVLLFKHLIVLVTPPTGVVLDPFVGSGTTLVASLQLGYRCIGIDKSDEYYGIAKVRTNEQRQLHLALDTP